MGAAGARPRQVPASPASPGKSGKSRQVPGLWEPGAVGAKLWEPDPGRLAPATLATPTEERSAWNQRPKFRGKELFGELESA